MIPFLARIEKEYFTLPDFHVADAGYGSEQNIENVTLELLRTALITYNMYRKVKKKKNIKTILLTPLTGIMMPKRMSLLVQMVKPLLIAMIPMDRQVWLLTTI